MDLVVAAGSRELSAKAAATVGFNIIIVAWHEGSDSFQD